jgi:hypothetical protein
MIFINVGLNDLNAFLWVFELKKAVYTVVLN